jgi:hypothetical protein
MAMYKINTNQTLTPFASLEPPHARIGETVEADLADNDEDVLAYVSPLHSSFPRPAVERDEAEEAYEPRPVPDNIIIKGGPVARLLQGPVLTPTAFSSRFVEGPAMPASPPRLTIEAQQMTPLASPVRTYGRDDRDLTSSVVKGHAASGLLELAHSR